MQRMCRIGAYISSCVLCLVATIAYGQEVNLGFNVSLIIGMPVLDKIGTPPYMVKTQMLNLNVTTGINLNVRIKDLCIETGANVSTRTTAFKLGLNDYSYNNINGSSYTTAKMRTKAHGYAFTVPVLLGYKLKHHEANTTYDVFGLLGAAYENYTLDAYAYEEHTGSQQTSTYTFTNTLNPYPREGYSSSWFNIVAGFKINAILRHVGLVEYGLRYHYPLSNAGKFTVQSIVSNSQYGSVYGGNFYPRMSYIDFHFTYYFFNVEKGTGLKKYKY